jgi:hypothetical protein
MGAYFMPPWDRTRFEAIVRIAGDHFGPILQSEAQVLAHSASSADLAIPTEDVPRPPIRPEFIRWLATDPDAAHFIDAKGIRIWSVTVPGRVDLQACRIPHQLVFLSCSLNEGILAITADVRALYVIGGESSGGLQADAIAVHGPLFVRNHTARGPICLVGSVVERNIDFTGTRLLSKQTALILDGATVEGSIFLHGGFESSGQVRMLNARIRGDLGCNGASLTATGKALSLDKVMIGGNMSLSEGFTSAGFVDLPGAQIVGDLDCGGASLTSKGVALNLASATIQGHVYLRNGFRCEGEICAHSTTVGKSFDCGGAALTESVTSVRLEKATVHGNVYFCEEFHATGRVELPGAELHGDLTCLDTTLLALYCLNMRLDGDLIWAGIRDPHKTSLWLNGAKIGTLRDEKASWPGPGGLHIDGLTYRELTLHDSRTDKDRTNRSMAKENELKAGDRLEWLRLQPATDLAEPHPWMQLAELLRVKGEDGGAKRVVFEMRKTQARSNWMLKRWWKVLLALLERQPLWILVTISLFAASGWLVFRQAACARAMAPTESAAYVEWHKGVALDTPCPPFNPLIYSVENGLPLVKFGQDDKWAPDPTCTPAHWYTSYTFLASFRWFLILAGWAQATILASAIKSRFKT